MYNMQYSYMSILTYIRTYIQCIIHDVSVIISLSSEVYLRREWALLKGRLFVFYASIDPILFL